eukprot:364429-Chlamydomonas_euryale.AAC.23
MLLPAPCAGTARGMQICSWRHGCRRCSCHSPHTAATELLMASRLQALQLPFPTHRRSRAGQGVMAAGAAAAIPHRLLYAQSACGRVGGSAGLAKTPQQWAQ